MCDHEKGQQVSEHSDPPRLSLVLPDPPPPPRSPTVTISRDLAERLNKHMSTLAAEARNEDWVNKDEIQAAWAEIHRARSQ